MSKKYYVLVAMIKKYIFQSTNFHCISTLTVFTLIQLHYKYRAKMCILTLESMDGSAEMTAERAFIAFVLMATALSFSTLRICVIQANM